METETPPPTSPRLVHLGRLRPCSEPLLKADDGLVLHGRGVFETLAAYRGRPFLAGRHFARLREGATRLGLRVPDDGILHDALSLALEANGLAAAEPARLRITLSSPADGSESWWVEATPPPVRPARARLVVVPWTRNAGSALAGCKTPNYGENHPALSYAAARGGDEALFANWGGELCEGAWSNVFLRTRSGWTTPPPATGCLPGVTRGLVLELAREIGLAVEERALCLGDLPGVEAAFLTSSLRGIQPAESIDGRALLPPDPAEAEIEGLRQAYLRRVEETAP